MSAPQTDSPLATWSHMFAIGFDMQRTWMKATETLLASQRVIDARTILIRNAGQSPLTGDYRELSRMVPEKIEAFTQSGAALTQNMAAMHQAFLSQGQAMAAAMLSGNPFWMLQGSRQAFRSIDAVSRMGAATLAPIHKTATANARRLAKRKKQ
ncbi:hypothetical protein [Sphingobium sp. CCH11-B1]|jgi:hypothetical protein|uniref:hypothetical protein n=1 Tax=Sphingobium sp. CCH11-B1 TaxID=1768781 RepID=UPI000836E52A|nr:hypothetical protein [Sphingobium sp. CCH11-B1]MEA3389863.1 hypothetical protein [Pseudomonadota bacterium]